MMKSTRDSDPHKRIKKLGTLSHRTFQDAYNLSLSMLQSMQPGRVLALVGPSRAGKSELIDNLIKALSKGIRPARADDVPILRIEGDLGSQQRMSLKEFVIEGLQNLKHPVFADFANLLDGDLRRATRISEPTLRPMFIKALQARGTLYIFVDEAHHLLMTARTKLQADILDAIKNICNKSKVVLVLVGGYSLLNGLFLSAHFNGRLQLIEFAAYANSVEDRVEYASLLKKFQSELLLSEPELLVTNAELIQEIYWGTLGGTIDGLIEAEARRIARKGKTLKMSDIIATRLPFDAMKVVKNDIEFGREFFMKSYPVASPKPESTAEGRPADEAVVARSQSKKSTKPAKPKKSKPFVKNPARRYPAQLELK